MRPRERHRAWCPHRFAPRRRLHGTAASATWRRTSRHVAAGEAHALGRRADAPTACAAVRTHGETTVVVLGRGTADALVVAVSTVPQRGRAPHRRAHPEEWPLLHVQL